LWEEICRFTYFFFAPTLVYRDDYVKSGKVHYSKVAKYTFSFLIIIVYLWTVFKALCIPIFKTTVDNPGSLRQFIHSVLFSTVSGIVCILSLFYGMLHCWFNIFAELLSFGDRCFYEDWWNVKDFANYYRKWNIVVHDFLYYYVY
jgi:sterol O-acyltransferase